MEYLAIRNSEQKNVFYYNTKGEKGRILSKFPNSSTRVFPESAMQEAIEWAGVDHVATEEENNWAITKQAVNKTPVEETKPEIKEVETIPKPLPLVNVEDATPIENTQPKEEVVEDKTTIVNTPVVDDKVVNPNVNAKHEMSDFEKIVELYKKSGVKVLSILLKNGTNITLLVDDLYYISNLGENNFDLPLVAFNEVTLKNKIICLVEKRKANGEKGAIFNNHLTFEMFDKIPKTKYLAFGDLVYIMNGGPIREVRENDNKISCHIEEDVRTKHLTFNTTNIVSILPYDLNNYDFLVREKEFVTYIKRTLKQIEKKKKKEKLENATK